MYIEHISEIQGEGAVLEQGEMRSWMLIAPYFRFKFDLSAMDKEAAANILSSPIVSEEDRRKKIEDLERMGISMGHRWLLGLEIGKRSWAVMIWPEFCFCADKNLNEYLSE